MNENDKQAEPVLPAVAVNEQLLDILKRWFEHEYVYGADCPTGLEIKAAIAAAEAAKGGV